MALFLCGARVLSMKLFNEGASRLDFDWTHRRHRIWYPFVMKFRKLSSLSVAATYQRLFHRFELSRNFVTLKELSLTMPTPYPVERSQCLDNLPSNGKQPLNLGEYCPVLEKLVLTGFTVGLPFIVLLPPTLKHLQVTIRSGSDIWLSTAALEALPRGLTHLDLKPNLTASQAIHLPRTLKWAKLQMTVEWDKLDLLPRTLTWLEAPMLPPNTHTLLNLPPFIKTVKDLNRIQIAMHIDPALVIPDHVTHLSVHRYFMHQFAGLPSCLTHLDWESAAGISLAAIPPLPLTLTHLSISCLSDDCVSEHVQLLPRSLRSLSLVKFAPFSADWLKAAYPAALTSLDLTPHYKWENTYLETLPQNLVNLRFLHVANMKKLNHVGVSYLPRTLTTLSIYGSFHIAGNCFVHLPPSLTSFNFERGPTVHDLNIRELPRSLTYLRIYDAAHLTNDCFVDLPRRLRSLVLNGPHTAFKPAQNVQSLPHSLTLLEFADHINDEMNSAYYGQTFPVWDSDDREDLDVPLESNGVLAKLKSLWDVTTGLF